MPIPRQPINEKTPLETRKAFKLNGRAHSPGNPFPWTRLSVPWRRVRILYESGFIVIAKEKPKPPVVFLTLTPEDLSDIETLYIDELPEEKRVEFFKLPVDDARIFLEAIMSDEQPEATEQTDAKTAPVVELRHRGGGWYDVIVDGEQVNEKPIRKDEAEDIAETYQV